MPVCIFFCISKLQIKHKKSLNMGALRSSLKKGHWTPHTTDFTATTLCKGEDPELEKLKEEFFMQCTKSTSIHVQCPCLFEKLNVI